MNNKAKFIEHSLSIRKNIIDAGFKSGSSHFGGSLSCVDILSYLFSKQMKYNLEQKDNGARDRFILSKGHCALGLYATLCEFGFISYDDLYTFNKNESDFLSHCVKNVQKGIELSSGSLGLGMSFAIGQALSLIKKKLDNKIYVLAGNGELNEGTIWESAMFVGCKNINNIVLIIDDNKMQLDGHSSKIMPVCNISDKFKAFGWSVVEIDGHNFDDIERAFQEVNYEKPLVIVANTIKGKGVSFMENSAKWHHAKMSDAEYTIALSDIRGV